MLEKGILSKVSILKSSPFRHYFWQTLFSILLGVTTGLLLVSFTQRRPAEALTKSSMLGAGSNGGPIQILPMLSERMTVLVMGVDSNGRDTERFVNTRSDTMILVSLDPLAHRVGIVSIPRDSRVKLAGEHGLDKINAAHALGGPALSVQTVSENFSVPINHYVVVDTVALKELCQLLGPVELLVEKEMHYHDWAAHLHIDLKPGLQTLTPEQVEQYVRYRHDAKGDIGRMERQQWFFRAAAQKLRDPQFLLKLPDLIRMAHDYVQTDLSLEDMARIATFAKDVKTEDVVTATLPGVPEMINGGSYWVPDIDSSRAVFNRILGLSNGGGFVALAGGNSSAPGANSSQLVSDTAPGAGTDLPAVRSDAPLVVALKYSKGGDQAASFVEKALTLAGYKVRYKWLMPLSECQHDQVLQMSARASDDETKKLCGELPQLHGLPIVLQLEAKPIADFSVVISPQSPLIAEAAARADAEKAVTDGAATTPAAGSAAIQGALPLAHN